MGLRALLLSIDFRVGGGFVLEQAIALGGKLDGAESKRVSHG